MKDISDEELGRRLSAGRGYRRESVKEFAERIGVNRLELADWEKGQFGSDLRFRTTARKRKDAVRRVQLASGLPGAFFRVDFRELPAMAEAWRRVNDPEARRDFELAAQMQEQALESELADESLRSQTSETRNEESEPGPESR